MLRDFVFVDDVVTALRLCSGNKRVVGETLNVGTSVGVTLQEAAAEMFRALASNPDMFVSGRYRLGDVRHAVADITRLDSTLGFRPQISFSQGLKRYVEWALENRQYAPDAVADDDLLARNLLRQGGK